MVTLAPFLWHNSSCIKTTSRKNFFSIQSGYTIVPPRNTEVLFIYALIQPEMYATLDDAVVVIE